MCIHIYIYTYYIYREREIDTHIFPQVRALVAWLGTRSCGPRAKLLAERRSPTKLFNGN